MWTRLYTDVTVHSSFATLGT